VNITYKILYNDASAMTGGQPVEGHPTVAMITNQLHGEGVRRIAVVSDEPDKYPSDIGFAPGTTIHHRDEMEALQIELRAIRAPPSSSMTRPAPPKSAGGGSAAPCRTRRPACSSTTWYARAAAIAACSRTASRSNPSRPIFGRKRHINQSSCNKDYSCKSGFCPSFVTVEGGSLRKHKAKENVAELVATLPQPPAQSLDKPYNLVVTGIGGTGVITVGALLGMAAHIEGKGSSVLDSIGLAQKNGSVLSYVRVAARPEDLHTARIPLGATDWPDRLRHGGGRRAGEHGGVGQGPHPRRGQRQRDADRRLRSEPRCRHRHQRAVEPPETALWVRTRSTSSMRRSCRPACWATPSAQNVMLLGAAYQKGLLPFGLEALEQAIEMNGVSIKMNREAFAWGRLAAHDLAMVETDRRPQAGPQGAGFGVGGGHGGPPRRLPDRLPERCLCGAVPVRWWRKPKRRSRRPCPAPRLCQRRWPAITSS